MMAKQPTELREMVRLKVRRIDLVTAPANRREFLAIKGELDEEMLEESEVQKSMDPKATTTQAQTGGDVSSPTQAAGAQAQPTNPTNPAQAVDKAANLASALRRIYDTLAKHAANWPQEAKQALQELAQVIAGNYAYAYPTPGQKQDPTQGQPPAPATTQTPTQPTAQPTQKGEATASIQEAITAALQPLQDALEAQKADLGAKVDGLVAKVNDLDQRLTRMEELRGVRKSAVGQQVSSSASGKKSIWGNILGPY